MFLISLVFLTLVSFQSGNGQTDPIAHHVVHIGIDGLRPDCIELAPGGAPNMMDRLVTEGASTLTLARTVTRTMSAMGWGATFLAMSPELTGIKSNFWSPPWLDPPNTTYIESHVTPIVGNNVPLPTVFQVIETQEADIETAAFYLEWEFFDYMTDVGYPGVVDVVEKCYDSDYGVCDQILTENFVDYLGETFISANKSYSFIYIGNVDQTGHATGWCGANYSAAVATADLQVGQILDTIDGLGYADDTLVMLSADHGGEGRLHGLFQDEDLNIPMFIKGPGIRQNYEFNYKVRNMDMAPTAVRVLGLEPSPWWEGTVMKEAFEDNIL